MKKQLFLALCLTLSSANLFCPPLHGGGRPQPAPAPAPTGGQKKTDPTGGNPGSNVTITPATIASAGLGPTEQSQLLAALGSIATAAANGATPTASITALANALVTNGTWTGTVASLSSKPSTKLGRMSSRKKSKRA